VAGGQERILRNRIKTVESTKKITRAMELIAATRVVKAQERAAASRPYAEEITSVILDLVKAGAARDHPLLRQHPEADGAKLALKSVTMAFSFSSSKLPARIASSTSE